MKKTAVLSGLMALTLLLGGCSAQQAADNLFSVNKNLFVINDLSCFTSCSCKSKTEYYVIQS